MHDALKHDLRQLGGVGVGACVRLANSKAKLPRAGKH